MTESTDFIVFETFKCLSQRINSNSAIDLMLALHNAETKLFQKPCFEKLDTDHVLEDLSPIFTEKLILQEYRQKSFDKDSLKYSQGLERSLGKCGDSDEKLLSQKLFEV